MFIGETIALGVDGATLTVRYPNSWSGLEVHVYGFVVAPSGKASQSEYIGHAELS